jgi:hypothetical protein
VPAANLPDWRNYNDPVPCQDIDLIAHFDASVFQYMFGQPEALAVAPFFNFGDHFYASIVYTKYIPRDEGCQRKTANKKNGGLRRSGFLKPPAIETAFCAHHERGGLSIQSIRPENMAVPNPLPKPGTNPKKAEGVHLRQFLQTLLTADTPTDSGRTLQQFKLML